MIKKYTSLRSRLTSGSAGEPESGSGTRAFSCAFFESFKGAILGEDASLEGMYFLRAIFYVGLSSTKIS